MTPVCRDFRLGSKGCQFIATLFAPPARFKLVWRYAIKFNVEKIDAQRDHLELDRFRPGTAVTFKGKRYLIQRRTTLASGEAAVVLEGAAEQFVIASEQFLAGVDS